MQGIRMYLMIILFMGLALILPCLRANIADFDDVWEKRASESWRRTLESYEPEPEKIVSHLNMHVKRTLKEIEDSSLNSTRRELAEGSGCRATNPIDKCWRCHADWADNRFKLAECGLGFGYKATGGKNGHIYIVTDPSDDDVKEPKNGTLRYAVIQKDPLWIIFERDMSIKLTQELIMQGDKTIDARGAKVEIANGAGITIQYVKNVIIHGLQIHNILEESGGMVRDSLDHFGLRTKSDGDGISIFGSQDVWIDHVSMTKCADGLIDSIMGSTSITISNSHFKDHDHVMLFGASENHSQDEKMQVTVAFNHFDEGLIQRMPMIRWGYAHVVNNDYTHWQMYAIGGNTHPTIVSQGNRFIASLDYSYAKEVTKRIYNPESEWKHWTWVSQGDQFQEGAFFVPSGDQDYLTKHTERNDHITVALATDVAEITKFAGSLDCRVGEAC